MAALSSRATGGSGTRPRATPPVSRITVDCRRILVSSHSRSPATRTLCTGLTWLFSLVGPWWRCQLGPAPRIAVQVLRVSRPASPNTFSPPSMCTSTSRTLNTGNTAPAVSTVDVVVRDAVRWHRPPFGRAHVALRLYHPL